MPYDGTTPGAGNLYRTDHDGTVHHVLDDTHHALGQAGIAEPASCTGPLPAGPPSTG